MIERDHAGRDLAVDRPHPARPLHRGHLPDLRVRQRARRPVRQLRQPARPDRPDQPAAAGSTARRRSSSRPSTSSSTCRRWPRRSGAWLRDPHRLAPERAEVLAEPARRHPAAGDDPRHRLGHPGAAARLGGQPDQAPLRVVRRGHRLPVGLDRVGPPHRRPRRAGAQWWTADSRRPRPTTSWARTTSPSTRRSGRPSCSRYNGEGAQGRRARASSASSRCRPRWCPASS